MLDDRKIRITRLIDLIEGINRMIQHLKESQDSFQLETGQYQRLKARYERELIAILTTEMGIELTPA